MKISIVFVRAGGGHLSTAKALSEELRSLYPDVEITLYDAFSESNRLIRTVIEKGYSTVSNYLPHIWSAIYLFSKPSAVAKLEIRTVSMFIKEKLRKYILRERPEKIISVHFFLTKPIYEIIKEEKLNTKLLTIVTDPFTCHPIWFSCPEVDLVAFSDQVKSLAIKHSVAPNKITVLPTVVGGKFNTKLPDEKINELKRNLGFSPDKHVVLITGGGEGLQKGEVFLRELAKTNLDIELAIVCGRNQKLKQKSEKIAKEYPNKRIAVYSFVDFIYELINISSVVITKGGPATVMEVLLIGKPLIITSYLWEQEKGNVEFVLQNKLGLFETNPKKVAQIVSKLISNEEELKTLSENIKKAEIKNGVTEVAKFIHEF
ncbi:MAG: glycosyltransferase [Brevinematia bacterium]